jgi:dTDP-4-dehydrorhamnose 3,5-epimerase
MDGVILTYLKQIHHPKGDIFHAIKKSDQSFESFGEAYFTTVNYGYIKGWKKHNKMVLNLVVISGEVEFVVFNGTEFEAVTLSQQNYQRLTVQPNNWVAFRGVGTDKNLILNIASIEHDSNEAVNCGLEDITYEWSM